MRILYGVQTTGNGHLVRSIPMILKLRELGHQVDVLLSGPPAHSSWLDHLGRPLRIRPGLTFAADGGRIRYLRTALRARPLGFLRDVFRSPVCLPDLVVTDFEPITAWIARHRGLRSIGIGHQYAFVWPRVPRSRGNVITRTVLDRFAPASVSVGMHYDSFGAPVLPPIIDPEIRGLARDRVESDLILVYLPFEPSAPLVQLLQGVSSRRFRVYAKVAETKAERNVTIRPISRLHFIEDLRRCGGVISNAGFSLTSECLHFGIPVLVKPIDGHLEQESNALALEHLGIGTVRRRLTPNSLRAWLELRAPAARDYPDVAGGIIRWLDAGAVESLAALSDGLWAGSRNEPGPDT